MDILDSQIIEACNNSITMSKACATLKMNYKTFIKRAKSLGVYRPNKSGKGISKSHNGNKIEISEILSGKYPEYQSHKLRVRLLDEGFKEHKCECCGNIEWNNQKIPLELNHIDGDRHNHLIENLEVLCPNCHAQTPTFRSKNIKNHK